jgi:phosphoribosylglycinamide formyltransferase-1
LKKRKESDQINLAIFASGNGSNAINIIDYFKERENIVVKKIFCNKSEAPVINKAESKGISSFVFDKLQLEEDNLILTQLKALDIDYIILAGFLLKIPEYLVRHFENKIINIHPALLPKYGGKGMYGMHVHQAVVNNKESKTGISIHYVNENYDEGNIIFQAECEVLNTDTANDVAGKIHELEMKYFPRIIEQTIKGF